MSTLADSREIVINMMCIEKGIVPFLGVEIKHVSDTLKNMHDLDRRKTVRKFRKNYCGLKNDLIEFVVDASPHKQGKYLPGSHIPIVTEEMIKNNKPDYILILPWNLMTEITGQLKYTKEWDAKFVLPIPKLEII